TETPGNILRTGYIPHWKRLNASEEEVFFETSGLAGGISTTNGLLNDDASYNNIPKQGGKTVNPYDFSSEILSGFTSTYEKLIEHQSQLISKVKVADFSVRVIFRNTRDYSAIMNA